MTCHTPTQAARLYWLLKIKRKGSYMHSAIMVRRWSSRGVIWPQGGLWLQKEAPLSPKALQQPLLQTLQQTPPVKFTSPIHDSIKFAEMAVQITCLWTWIRTQGFRSFTQILISMDGITLSRSSKQLAMDSPPQSTPAGISRWTIIISPVKIPIECWFNPACMYQTWSRTASTIERVP